MICRIFGHDREYVAIRRVSEKPHQHQPHGTYPHEFCKCNHGKYLDHGCDKCAVGADVIQEARWVCRRKACPAMGHETITKSRGLFKVEFGLLVPDKKGWANFDAHDSSEVTPTEGK